MAAHQSEANKEASLVERKLALFQLLATRGRGREESGGDRLDPCPKANSLSLTVNGQELLKGSFRGV